MSEDGHYGGLQFLSQLHSQRAAEMENKHLYLHALDCYERSISCLLDLIKTAAKDWSGRSSSCEQVTSLMARAEKLKNLVECEKRVGVFEEQIDIAEDDVGFGYETVFSVLIDEKLTSVNVEDANLDSQAQLLNFVRFCELLFKRATRLKSLYLTTSRPQDSEKREFQRDALIALRNDLLKRGIKFEVRFGTSLIESEITFDNGWLVRLENGLDYFKPQTKYSVGSCDLDLRKCVRTKICVLYRPQ